MQLQVKHMSLLHLQVTLFFLPAISGEGHLPPAIASEGLLPPIIAGKALLLPAIAGE